MNRTLTLVIAVVAAIALAGGGFAAGMSIGASNAQGAAASASASARAGQGARQGAGGQGQLGGGQGGRAVNGQVLSVGDGTITIQLGADQGGSRIVLVAPSTRLVRTSESDIQLSGIKAGERVMVIGQENADGTVNAQAVVVGGNVLQGLFGSPRPSASPSPSR